MYLICPHGRLFQKIREIKVILHGTIRNNDF